MNVLYLTRRNLLTLLSKLDRQDRGEQTTCAIRKVDCIHPKYPCSAPTLVVAVEDNDYYYERDPGPVDPSDQPRLSGKGNQ